MGQWRYSSALDENEWSASRPGRFTPRGEKAPVPVTQEAVCVPLQRNGVPTEIKSQSWEHKFDIKHSFTEMTSVHHTTSSSRKLASSSAWENGFWVLVGLKGYGVATLKPPCPPRPTCESDCNHIHISHAKQIVIYFILKWEDFQ
jgi:hypothetical protein